VAPPFDSTGGRYWALVKLMNFGRIIYSEAVEVIIEAPDARDAPIPRDASQPAEAAAARAR
jgi:hypothetical protein